MKLHLNEGAVDRALPQSELGVLPGSGHAIEPAAVDAAVAFLVRTARI